MGQVCKDVINEHVTVIAGTITSVYPNVGPNAGTFQVTISGTFLGNGSDIESVQLAGVLATSIVSQTSSEVIVVAGTSIGGAGDVLVNSTTQGVTSLANGFTYLARMLCCCIPFSSS